MSINMLSRNDTVSVDPAALEKSIASATEALLGYRQSDGHWVFELEADSTIPAEYVLLRHYLGEPVDATLEAKIANYLRRVQGAHGGWPLVHEGAFDMSASVKSYFALKMIGDSVDTPHMVRAREAIRSRGGASGSNVFTRFMLALFGVMTWRAVPVLPIEIMLLPMWSPFHINKISYWARTTIVPLMVLAALKPRAKNPIGIGIDELFLQDPKSVGMTAKAPHQSWGWFLLFRALDAVLRVIEPLFPKKLRQRAIDAALAFIEERLNGEDGMGAIYPPMANIVMMYEVLGKGEDFPPRAVTRRGIDKLLVIGEHEAYCQPCVSPVWDTALTCHALAEAGGEETLAKMKQGLDWLKPRQVLDLKGDWAVKAPNVRPGGWAFQYNNDYYPDLDDTAVVVMAMDRVQRQSGSHEYDTAIARGREWIEGLQSRDGGWAAFDVNNLEYYLNNIPFSDHGALLDPPTEDVTARCVSMLAQLGETEKSSKAVADGVAYLRRTQLAEGSWYGRWGLNYIYGTWSVLSALNAAGIDHQDPVIRKAVDWLVAIQNNDGGWGEDAVSYRLDYRGFEGCPSTSSQTAWALLGLMAAGEVENPAVSRGVEYLKVTQTEKGLWDEPRYTATGFPRVFYLRYHGYSKFFPLWAMARYRNLRSTNSRVVGVGM
jgi:squalene-hopene/tetraprenyl-beta-curcumene cyclase